MPEAETLRVIAELAIAIAGFSGVVVVLRRQAVGSWEVGRLWMLLVQAVGAALFAFVPLLLEMAGLSASVNWRFSNGALGLFNIGVVAGVVVTTRASRHYEFVGWRVLVGLCVIHISIGLCSVFHALGGLPSIGAFLYSLSLVWLLAMACLNFMLLVLRDQTEERRGQ